MREADGDGLELNRLQLTGPLREPYHFPLRFPFVQLLSEFFILRERAKKTKEFPSRRREREGNTAQAIQPFMLILIANYFKHVITGTKMEIVSSVFVAGHSFLMFFN